MFRQFLLGSTTLCRAPDGGAEGGGAAASDGATATGAGGDTGAAAAASAGAAAAAATDGGDGDVAAAADLGWVATLPEDQRAWVKLKGYASPADLVKAAHSAERGIGLDKVPLPKPDSPKEVWDEFYKRLGRPDSADGYKFEAPKDVPDYDPGVAKVVGAIFHEAGLTAAQAAIVHDRFMGLVGKSMGASQAQLETTKTNNTMELQTLWGAAFDAKREQANAAIARFGGEKLIAKLAKTGLNTDPDFNNAFAAIGALLAGDSLAGVGATSGSAGGGFIKTPAEAKAEIAKIEGDTKGPYYVKDHPDHQRMVQVVADLYKQAFPE